MPSMRYKMTEQLYRHTVKPIMDGSREEFVDFVYSMAKKRSLEVPSRTWQSRFDYSEIEDGELTIVKIGPKEGGNGKLVIYLTGDGLYMPPSAADFELCKNLILDTGTAVWLVSYPLIPYVKPGGIINSVFISYQRALKEYDAADITVLGISAGGNLALGLCFYIEEHGNGEPLPGGLILQSVPLKCPPTPQQAAKMREIEPRDVTMTADYFSNIAVIDNFFGCEYLLRPLDYDMRGFPPIDIFYGTYEMGYAYLEDFEKKCSEEGVELREHIGDKMMHSWCLLTGTSEAKKVCREYCDIIKGK